MDKCFVIQPFDKGAFDKRFDDHVAPAIKNAGLEPYRVDRDPGVRIPIESIHKGISEAGACLADITTNNPNVWYELGYALASQKEVILICSKERTDAFPFDVRHLNIIHYSTNSGRDFTELEGNITKQLSARLTESKKLQNIASMSPLSEVEGLSPHETAALVILMENAPTPDSSVNPWELKREMENAGFTSIAANLSIESLIRKDMVKVIEVGNAFDEETKMYEIQKSGINWLLQNQDKLKLRKNVFAAPKFTVAPKPLWRKDVKPTEEFDDSDPFADE